MPSTGGTEMAIWLCRSNSSSSEPDIVHDSSSAGAKGLHYSLSLFVCSLEGIREPLSKWFCPCCLLRPMFYFSTPCPIAGPFPISSCPLGSGANHHLLLFFGNKRVCVCVMRAYVTGNHTSPSNKHPPSRSIHSAAELWFRATDPTFHDRTECVPFRSNLLLPRATHASPRTTFAHRKARVLFSTPCCSAHTNTSSRVCVCAAYQHAFDHVCARTLCIDPMRSRS